MDEAPVQMPRWRISKGLMLPLGLGAICAVAVLVGTFWHSSAEPHSPVPVTISSVSTPNPSTATSLTKEVNDRESNGPHDAQPLPQAQPMRSSGQAGMETAEYRRQRLEIKLQEGLTPTIGIPPQWMMQAQQGASQPANQAVNPSDAQLIASLAGMVPPTPKPAAPVISTAQSGNPFVVTNGTFNSSVGKSYFVPESSTLQAELINKMDGDFNGPVLAKLTRELRTRDGQKVLIPTEDPAHPKYKTVLIGESHQVQSMGQRKLAMAFTKAVLPDGYEVWFLDNTPAGDEQGATGVKGHVNNHYLSSFGAAMAIGLLSAGSYIGVGNDPGGAGYIRMGVGSSLSNSSVQILDRFLNRMPTITVPPGTPVLVYLSADYQFPAYEDHRMPKDL